MNKLKGSHYEEMEGCFGNLLADPWPPQDRSDEYHGVFMIHERLPSPCCHKNEMDHLPAWQSIEDLLPNTYERHVTNQHMAHFTKIQVIYHSGHTKSHAPMEACNVKQLGTPSPRGTFNKCAFPPTMPPTRRRTSSACGIMIRIMLAAMCDR